jgi:hypothetical protein
MLLRATSVSASVPRSESGRTGTAVIKTGSALILKIIDATFLEKRRKSNSKVNQGGCEIRSRIINGILNGEETFEILSRLLDAEKREIGKKQCRRPVAH